MRRKSTRKILRDVVEGMEALLSLVSGLLDRESRVLAMIDTLNDRDEVIGKLVGMTARISAELAVALDRVDLAEEIRDTVEMAGAVMDQMSTEFRRKT